MVTQEAQRTSFDKKMVALERQMLIKVEQMHNASQLQSFGLLAQEGVASKASTPSKLYQATFDRVVRGLDFTQLDQNTSPTQEGQDSPSELASSVTECISSDVAQSSAQEIGDEQDQILFGEITQQNEDAIQIDEIEFQVHYVTKVSKNGTKYDSNAVAC